jgi:hypothetical protein
VVLIPEMVCLFFLFLLWKHELAHRADSVVTILFDEFLAFAFR